MTSNIDSDPRLVDDLLQRDIGIDRYFTYIVTRTVKDEAVIPIGQLIAAGDR